MKVFVDKETCIGCGTCVAICPNVFRMDDEEKSEVFAEPTPSDFADVENAAMSCPVNAISFEK